MLTVRLTGIDRPHHAAEQFGERLRRRGRQAARRVGRRDQPVEVDLARRQRALQARPLAELDLGGAVELRRALLGSVLEFDLLQQRGLRVRLHLAGELPRLVHHRLAACLHRTHRPRHREAAVETRRCAIGRNQPVHLDGERPFGDIDVEFDLDAVVERDARPRSGSRGSRHC